VVGFTHYRPIISVDVTLLIGKYKDTLMVAVGMTLLTYSRFAVFSIFLKYNLTFVIKQKLELSTCPPHMKNKKNILTSQSTLFKGNR
jgi:hypothetical protein